MPRHRTTYPKWVLRHLRDLDFEAEERLKSCSPAARGRRRDGAGLAGAVTHRGLSQTSDIEKYIDLDAFIANLGTVFGGLRGGSAGEVVEEVEGGDGGALPFAVAHEEAVAAEDGGPARAPAAQRAQPARAQRRRCTHAKAHTRVTPPYAYELQASALCRPTTRVSLAASPLSGPPTPSTQPSHRSRLYILSISIYYHYCLLFRKSISFCYYFSF